MKQPYNTALYMRLSRDDENYGDSVSIETFLLDFDGDLYGKRIRLEFCRRLREEKKFDTPQQLKDEIEKNIAQTREYFRETGEA